MSLSHHQTISEMFSDTDDSEDEEEIMAHPHGSIALSLFSAKAGLPKESKFLSHWFGLTKSDESALCERLPRPSAWNKFVRADVDARAAVPATNSFALRQWTFDAGLSDDSKFLSHWFGLAQGGVCKDQLPRPSAWNKFVTEHNNVNQSKGAEKNRFELRQWAFDSGLPEESRFLSHWFALANAEADASEGALPRPSPWNHFVNEAAIVDCLKVEEEEELSVSHEELALRAFAVDTGLPEESKFLSHWFGVTKEGALSEQLPRPSAWNKFVRADVNTRAAVPATNSFALRQWTFDAGLSDDSKFLSHWFGLAQGCVCKDQLPRPSAWNKFVTEHNNVNQSKGAEKHCF